jgi:hypothetical protein
MTTKQDLTFRRGEDWTFTFAFQNADKTPMNLTGVQAIEWRVATIPDIGEGELVVMADLDNGVSVTGLPTAGTGLVRVRPADQGDRGPGHYVHECYVKLADGSEPIPAAGKFELLRGLKAELG